MDILKINNINWPKTKICILGAGRSGLSAANLALSLGANVLISDSMKNFKMKKHDKLYIESGKHSNKILNSDIIIISPGISDKIDIISKCRTLKIPIISEIEFSSWFTSAPILAITGSNGKTTTATLLFNMVKNAGYNAMLGGNIGIPFSENVFKEIKLKYEKIVHVLELSSFQLEHIQHFKPNFSCILNISPDHLNRYETMDKYIKAKINIAKNLTAPAWLVYNGSDSTLSRYLRSIHRTKLFSLSADQQVHYYLKNTEICSKDKVLIHTSKVPLKGQHNIENVIAAATIANLFGISDLHIKDAISNFNPLEHRMEHIKSILPFTFINDSKATNIASTIAAIKNNKKITLILGGEDKSDTNFSLLNESINKNVYNIICYGKSGGKISTYLSKKINTYVINDFEIAVLKAIEISKKGATILLSPACASFDQFSDYKDRGNKFKEIINSTGKTIYA